MRKLDALEIDNRLIRLVKVLEWVATDVTASFDEKMRARNLETMVNTMIEHNRMGGLVKADLEFANNIWVSYTNDLTGSNVPIQVKRLVDGK